MSADHSYQDGAIAWHNAAFDHSYQDGAALLIGDVSLLQSSLVDRGKHFPCLYIDPPWRYADTNARGAAERYYVTMSLEAIRAMPVAHLASPQAHLYLWCTKDFLHAGFHLLEHWGFASDNILVWNKYGLGTGHRYRNGNEFLLFGIRGSLAVRRRDMPTWFLTGRGMHSRKPDEARRIIEAMSPGPYLELFGREAVPGWTVWGNQIELTLFTRH